MNHYLCKYEYNWADECDFSGFEIIDDKEREFRQKVIDLMNKYEIDPQISIGYGSNEYDDDFRLSWIVDAGEIIAEETYDDLNKLFFNGSNWSEFGFVPNVHDSIYYLLDECDVNLEYDVDKNPEKLEEDELNEIRFYQELKKLNE